MRSAGDADPGVGDLEPQLHGAVGARRAGGGEHDVAFVRELDGVADEIQDDLAQAAGVAVPEHGDIADVDHELDALDGGLQRHDGNRFVDHVA